MEANTDSGAIKNDEQPGAGKIVGRVQIFVLDLKKQCDMCCVRI